MFERRPGCKGREAHVPPARRGVRPREQPVRGVDMQRAWLCSKSRELSTEFESVPRHFLRRITYLLSAPLSLQIWVAVEPPHGGSREG